jgi:hypothetical protein
MSPAQRQAAFERIFANAARGFARRLGVGFAGTIRKLPPPPLPGELPGATRYYVNAVSGDGAPSLMELSGPALAGVRRAERWAETGEGPQPGGSARGRRTLKR